FWAINIGLMLEILLSLLPVGLMQTYQSVAHGYWSARSPEFLQTHLMQTLRWLRMIGDSIFAVGAVAFVYFALDLMWRRRAKVKAPATGVAIDAAFSAAIIFSERSFILPLMIAAPLAFIQLIYDWSGRKRVLFAEVTGAVAISSLAAASALAGGWARGPSFALWAIMSARSVSSI